MANTVTMYPLEKVKFAVAHYISRNALEDNYNLQGIIDDVSGHLRLQLTAEIWKIRTPNTTTISYPANWWEACKERWLSKRVRDYFNITITYTTHHIKAEALLPGWIAPKGLIFTSFLVAEDIQKAIVPPHYDHTHSL